MNYIPVMGLFVISEISLLILLIEVVDIYCCYSEMIEDNFNIKLISLIKTFKHSILLISDE
jgi:hypothetical protein